MGPRTVQTLEKECISPVDVAIRYYMVMFALNKVELSQRMIEVIAWTAVKGNLNNPTVREEFIYLFKSSAASLENIKCKLVKMDLLVKQGKKCKVNPGLQLDFSNDLTLNINLYMPKDVTDDVINEPIDDVIDDVTHNKPIAITEAINHDTIQVQRTHSYSEIEE